MLTPKIPLTTLVKQVFHNFNKANSSYTDMTTLNTRQFVLMESTGLCLETQP